MLYRNYPLINKKKSIIFSWIFKNNMAQEKIWRSLYLKEDEIIWKNNYKKINLIMIYGWIMPI
jgi:hypothetical protein